MFKIQQSLWALVLILCIGMTACVKDKTTRTYTITRPEYALKSAVYDQIQSSAPKPITNSGKIFIIGKYIYMSEASKGIHVINNSNPSAPINESFIAIPGIEDITVKGNTLLADCYTDLLSIDITDPSNVDLIKFTPNVFPERRFINGYTIDSSVIITSWITKDTTMTVASYQTYQTFFDNTFNGFSPGTTNSGSSGPTNGLSGSMARFTLYNNQYLYTVSQSTLRVFDVSNAQSPQFITSVSLGWNIETIYQLKDKLFIGSMSGMFIYSIANPSSPVQLSTFRHATLCDPVVADDKYAYITLRSGTTCQGFTNELNIVDIQQITTPVLKATYKMTNPHGLSKDGHICFICDGADGLRVYDVSDIMDAKLITKIPMATTYDVITYQNRAIVTAADGIYQYDYSDVNNIKLLSKLSK
ncbi:MAG: hypothetical protein KA198_01405 [Chitinophagaceae bacterium]|nr:hypothetical protein [Chitinophagaceae bacterium]